MPSLGGNSVVGVLGAGSMGGGIAQVAAMRGHQVVLVDEHTGALERAGKSLAGSLAREVEKGRTSADEAAAVTARIQQVRLEGSSAMDVFAECGIVIEAIVERLDAKRDAFARLENSVRAECVLATNTSSLSVSSIAAACSRPERVVGVHFFNPAPVMPLVELIPGLATAPETLAATRALVDGWGKSTVVATDTPGFIVNRVARPFYGEALRLLEEGIADAPTIDWAMRTVGGFRMGPFELMDFIGHDVNFAVTSSVYDAMFHDPRYRPSLTQQRLVEAGRLGRKSGLGFYDYAEGATNPPATEDRALAERIVERVVCMLINEAVDAVYLRIASTADVELAMTKGVNYPRGLLAWADSLGAAHVLKVLQGLQEEYAEDRYRPSPLLRRTARDGGRFLPA